MVAVASMLLAAERGPARAADLSPCESAIRSAEKAAHLPAALLGTIGIVESGRVDPVSRRVTPWPWTINIAGTDYVFETRADAIAAVERAQKAGRKSIDVGCMQVNLAYHPTAFSSLEEAFDPQANANYAALFLSKLYVQTRDWGDAAAAYHSQTPGVADDYRRRVVAGWSGAAAYGVTQTIAVTGASAGKPGAPRPKPEPEGGYTPEFRARLAQDAADARALRASMGLLPASARAAPALSVRSSPQSPAAQNSPRLRG